jgi:ATP-binding protein involved in chromosome partitioning
MTGRRIVDVADVPEQIKPTRLQYSGNYALKVAWNDGHDTGLYTWDYLAELGREGRGRER